MPARPSDQPNFRARRIALGVALLALCASGTLALTTRAPAQDATADLGAKLDELESNIDRQGAIQGSLDEQNARINDLIVSLQRHRTNPDALAADRSKDELYREAQDLGVEGRSDMSKDELAREVSRRK